MFKNYKHNPRIIVLCWVMMFAMMLSACKNTGTLEEYINSDKDAKEQIEQLANTEGLEMQIENNNIIYNYDVSEVKGISKKIALSDAMKTMLDEKVSAQEDSYIEICESIEKESNLKGIKIIVNYNYKGKLLYTKEFPQDK